MFAVNKNYELSKQKLTEKKKETNSSSNTNTQIHYKQRQILSINLNALIDKMKAKIEKKPTKG